MADLPNRWWVGLNVGSDQSTLLGTASFLSPNGYESLASGNLADDAKFAAAALTDKATSKPVTISVEGVSWYNINGPYSTQAEANAAIPAIQKAHPAPGEAQQLVNEAAAGNGQAGAASNPVSPSSILGLPVLSNLRDLVVRTVKVLAGLALIIVGVSKLTGTDKAVMSAAKTAGKAAVLA
jgi:hypothetical protein